MGRTLRKLSERGLEGKGIFGERFVVELCEAVHVHYRNLRILMSVEDWAEMARGMALALKRWQEQGEPQPQAGRHIELCRKRVAQDAMGDELVKINLNENLYRKHEGRIFAEGAEFSEPTYVHLKIRDLRVELSRKEFRQLAAACSEATAALNVEPEETCQAK